MGDYANKIQRPQGTYNLVENQVLSTYAKIHLLINPSIKNLLSNCYDIVLSIRSLTASKISKVYKK